MSFWTQVIDGSYGSQYDGSTITITLTIDEATITKTALRKEVGLDYLDRVRLNARSVEKKIDEAIENNKEEIE